MHFAAPDLEVGAVKRLEIAERFANSRKHKRRDDQCRSPVDAC